MPPWLRACPGVTRSLDGGLGHRAARPAFDGRDRPSAAGTLPECPIPDFGPDQYINVYA